MALVRRLFFLCVSSFLIIWYLYEAKFSNNQILSQLLASIGNNFNTLYYLSCLKTKHGPVVHEAGVPTIQYKCKYVLLTDYNFNNESDESLKYIQRLCKLFLLFFFR